MAEVTTTYQQSLEEYGRRHREEAMAEAAATYQRSLEEYGRRHFREGRDEGHRQGRDEGIRVGRDEGIRVGRDEGIRVGRDEGQVALLRQQVLEKFGPETAQALSSVLGEASDSKRTLLAASAVLESATADEFFARLRSL